MDVRWHVWHPSRAYRAGSASSVGTAALDDAVRSLTAGWIIAHPTSTVYGIGGRPAPLIDARIARYKGRGSEPLIVLARDVETLAREFPGLEWTETATRLADAFWPGPLTLVLAGPGGRTQAVRVDGHPVVQSLLEGAGGVMTSTSLNATGAEPARSRAAAWRAMGRFEGPVHDVGWLDVGDLPPSAASTLVRPGDGTLEVLREGAIPGPELERVL